MESNDLRPMKYRLLFLILMLIIVYFKGEVSPVRFVLDLIIVECATLWCYVNAKPPVEDEDN